jgi:hypothetical protein
VEKIIESLSQNERKIIPYLKEKNVEEISKKSKLDKISVLRSLDYLENTHYILLRILPTVCGYQFFSLDVHCFYSWMY